MSSVLFDAYHGIGDQIYMRPFILAAQEQYDDVYVVTDFPKTLYEGTGIKPIFKASKWKTQTECAELEKEYFVEPLPRYDKVLRPCYTGSFRVDKNKPVTQVLEEQTGLTPKNFHSLQVQDEWIDKALSFVKTDKPICFLRLPTVRNEWKCFSRNGKMGYFNFLIKHRIRPHFYTVSSLDLRNGLEWLDGDMPEVDLMLHENELGVDGMIGLLKVSAFCLSIPCNTLPICADIGTPLFLIYGGHVHHNFLLDPRMDTGKITAMQPSPFCNCMSNNHQCNKEVDTGVLSRTFNAFIRREVTCLSA